MTRRWYLPTTESLLEKRDALEQRLTRLDPQGFTDDQRRVLASCQSTLNALKVFDSPWRQHHPNQVWRRLHRVEADLYLLAPLPEVVADAGNLAVALELNLTEPRLQRAWLGSADSRGRLAEAIADLHDPAKELAARHTLRAAQHELDTLTDRHFWELAVSTLTSDLSAVGLAVNMVALWALGLLHVLPNLAADLTEPSSGSVLAQAMVAVALLGLIGAFLSNVLTREGFLYPRGGPFWRFFLLHLVTRPLMSALGAVLIVLMVSGGALGVDLSQAKGLLGQRFAYAILAVAAGFGADKLLRSTLGRVLNVLEQRAEKTKASPAPAPAAS